MVMKKIGFVGFGEVGSVFSEALYHHGAEIRVYDALLATQEGAQRIQKRVPGDFKISSTLSELIAHSDTILSTVTTQSARDVADQAARFLKPGQMYIDLNSTSPAVKVELADLISPSGADFVEGAILGAVGATGAATRLLTAGEKGQEAADLLNELGLKVSFYTQEIGQAAMFKMLRGIFSKGLEALILEVLIAGKRASINQDLWRDIVSFMSENPFEKVASNWVQSHAVAYERRYWEVTQIVETMQEIGVEPIMTAATETLFERSLSLGLAEAFPGKPHSYEEVVDYISKKLEGMIPDP
jgi:3-hydroxyisobutyrate dehydrogenase-like beta-hydroxyacid dehydrogenase